MVSGRWFTMTYYAPTVCRYRLPCCSSGSWSKPDQPNALRLTGVVLFTVDRGSPPNFPGTTPAVVPKMQQVTPQRDGTRLPAERMVCDDIAISHVDYHEFTTSFSMA